MAEEFLDGACGCVASVVVAIFRQVGGEGMAKGVRSNGLDIPGGFGSVEICGDLKGAPYDHTAKRLVAIARKQEQPACGWSEGENLQ